MERVLTGPLHFWPLDDSIKHPQDVPIMQKQTPAQRTVRARRAFTLIELLVVISIIALLIAILLPALGAARKSARMTQCLSNMRQWGISQVAHAVDNEGVVHLVVGPLCTRYSMMKQSRRPRE